MFLDLMKPQPGQGCDKGQKGRGGRWGVEVDGICGYGSSAAQM